MLRLLTFGGLSLGNGAAPLRGAALQRSRLALLAAIAAGGESGVSRDVLLAIFWPESDMPRARSAVKQALYSLRRDLDEPDILLGTDNLRLNPSVIVSDVGGFDAALRNGDLETAAGLYRGPFLAGVHIRGGGFARWKDAEEVRLATGHRRALSQLAKAAEQREDIEGAVTWWRALVGADPLNTTAAISLMRALVRSGDHASALRQADVHGQLVWAELEAEPDPAVLQLAAEIRRDLESAPVPPTGAKPAPRGVGESAGAIEAPIRAPRGSLRVVLAAGLATGAMAAALLVIKPWQADPDRVQIGITPAAEPTRDSLLASRLGHEILLRQPGLRVRLGNGRKAAYRVMASSRIDGDSAYLVGTVSEASGRRLDSLGPIAVETRASRTGMRALGEQAAIAIAAARSPLFRTWAAMAALPETWGSFQALEAGIKGWQIGGSESLALFDLAASRDPGSATPWVWKALTLAKSNRFNESDSVLAALDSSLRRFGPWDRAVVAVVRGWNRRDLPTSHAAGHQLLEIAPNSEWAILASYDALGVGRAREALELLRQIPSDVDWVRHWANVVRHQALYQTGDHSTALADARARLRVDPDNAFNQLTAIKALAGLGRVAEVEEACVRTLSQRRVTAPCTQAILEVRGRGHAAAARRLADRVLAALAASETTTREGLAEARAWLAYESGDWAGLEKALSEASRSLPENDVLLYRAMLWAAGGDRLAVGRALAQLTATGKLSALDRAEIAALLGDKDEAVELIGEAFRNGFRRGFPIFVRPGLDRLGGYPPFEALVRPIDDAEHRARSVALK